MRTKAVETTMPMLAVRGLVMFPKVVMHFDVSRKKSETALKAALSDDKRIFLTAQRDSYVEDPEMSDLYEVGVVAEIHQIIKMPDNITRVLVEGVYRARLIEIEQSEPYLVGRVRQMTNCIKNKNEAVETEAVMRAIKAAFKQYAHNMPKMPAELVSSILDEKDPELFFEAVTYNIYLPLEDRQMLLEENYLVSRLGMLLAMISRSVFIEKIHW